LAFTFGKVLTECYFLQFSGEVINQSIEIILDFSFAEKPIEGSASETGLYPPLVLGEGVCSLSSGALYDLGRII
jgi:hypothetical protein